MAALETEFQIKLAAKKKAVQQEYKRLSKGCKSKTEVVKKLARMYERTEQTIYHYLNS